MHLGRTPYSFPRKTSLDAEPLDRAAESIRPRAGPDGVTSSGRRPPSSGEVARIHARPFKALGCPGISCCAFRKWTTASMARWTDAIDESTHEEMNRMPNLPAVLFVPVSIGGRRAHRRMRRFPHPDACFGRLPNLFPALFLYRDKLSSDI